MSDFFQNGTITTLHSLNKDRLTDMEAELQTFAQKRTMGVSAINSREAQNFPEIFLQSAVQEKAV